MDEDDLMIPVVFHNHRGYDGQIFIKHITKDFATEDIVVIPTTSEKFISFQIGNLRFLDSLQFLSGSLDTLVQTLIKDGTQNFQTPSDIIRTLTWCSRRGLIHTNLWMVQKNLN